MKILYLIGGLDNGGKERLLRDVFEMRNALPFEAWCVCRKGFGEEEGIIYLRSKGIMATLRYLRGIVRSKQIQIIHAQSAYDSILAFLATLGLKVQIIQTLHSYEFAKSRHLKIMGRLAFAACRCSVFVSERQMSHFAAVHALNGKQRMKQVLVYNGVNFDRFGYAAHAPNPRMQMAMVGNFVPAKDQLFVCRFLDEMCMRGYAFDFYFIGKRTESYPECYDKCVDFCRERNLDDKVHFMGNRDDVPELLGKMDAFVYCSKSETFGLAVVEAISMGLPTFVNDLAVFDEITQEGRFATLFSTGNLQELCEKFVDFFDHRQDYVEWAEKNAQEVRNTYSIAAYVANLNALYSQILLEK